MTGNADTIKDTSNSDINSLYDIICQLIALLFSNCFTVTYCCNHYDYNKYEITASTDMLIQMMTIIMIVILVLIIEMRMAIKNIFMLKGILIKVM